MVIRSKAPSSFHWDLPYSLYLYCSRTCLVPGLKGTLSCASHYVIGFSEALAAYIHAYAHPLTNERVESLRQLKIVS